VDDVVKNKRALRQALEEKRRALAPDAVRAASEAVCEHLAALLPAGIVALYAPLPGEIDVTSLAVRTQAIWPRVTGKSPLTFHHAPLASLVLDRYGIPTPAADAPTVALDDCAVAVVPGVAFDASGRRLGRGGGYYDIALSAAPRPLRVGVCHGFQLVREVPTVAHDELVDVIVTPDGARKTGARPHPQLEEHLLT
jgi:5-formyltetrahydrofolate cyclo-ligase